MSCGQDDTLKCGACLHRVPVFECLTDEEKTLLQQAIRSHRYEKGEFIFREGEATELLFILNEGIVKITKCSGAGKEQVIRLMYPGEFFGNLPLLQERNQYANAEVLEAASVCLIHRNDLLKTIETNPKMAYRFLLVVNDLLQQADEWMSMISLMEVEQRLAKALLFFYEKSNSLGKQIIKLPIPKKELASLIGTTPETLSRKLALLEAQAVLSQAGRSRFQICNLEKLIALAEK